VAVTVVSIGNMRMGMSQFRVLMRMAVRTLRHRVMKMKVVAVIVRMGVFMRQRFVVVQMAVRFGQMQ
jgi:hypothetical protein